MSRRAPILLVAGSIVITSLACKDGTKPAGSQGAPPPSTPSGSGSVKASTCDPAAIGVSDVKVAALLPASVAGFCARKVDPVRSWGDGTGKKIEDVANEIDGAGDLYSKDYFAKRYDALRLADEKGTDASIDVALTTFDRPENAFALFTYRVVANSDPEPGAMKKAQRRAFQKIPSSGVAALGNASAVLWKGSYLVELTYNPDSTKTAAEATAAGDVVLPKIVAAMAEKIVGTVDLPADVRALPTEADGRVPLGIEYVPAKYLRPEGKTDALSVVVNGGYATAYMKEGDKRYRVLAFAREDPDAARDALAFFQKIPGALPVKDVSDGAVHFAFTVGGGGAGASGKAEGVVARRGSLVLAVIDEELALGDPTTDAGAWPRTTKDEKVAKLKKLFEANAAAPPPAPSASAK